MSGYAKTLMELKGSPGLLCFNFFIKSGHYEFDGLIWSIDGTYGIFPHNLSILDLTKEAANLSDPFVPYKEGVTP